MTADVRRYTNLLLDQIHDGVFCKDHIILCCVKYMSELDVQGMMEANELIRPDELDEEEEEQEEVRGEAF